VSKTGDIVDAVIAGIVRGEPLARALALAGYEHPGNRAHERVEHLVALVVLMANPHNMAGVYPSERHAFRAALKRAEADLL
jgi:hypothetical protein